MPLNEIYLIVNNGRTRDESNARMSLRMEKDGAEQNSLLYGVRQRAKENASDTEYMRVSRTWKAEMHEKYFIYIINGIINICTKNRTKKTVNPVSANGEKNTRK